MERAQIFQDVLQSNIFIPHDPLQDLRGFQHHWTLFKDQDSWINQQYLQSEFHHELYYEKMQIQEALPSQRPLFPNTQQAKTIISPSTPEPKSKHKSIFHNFQKHLKTLLKRLIVVRRSQEGLPPRAYELWKMFKDEASPSKRILYCVFGMQQREGQAQIIKIVEPLMVNSSFQQIRQVQSFLRSLVIEKLESMSKEQLFKQCKMVRLQDFHLYLINFIDELKKGGLSRRMTKECKMRLLTTREPQIP